MMLNPYTIRKKPNNNTDTHVKVNCNSNKPREKIECRIIKEKNL